MYSWCRLSGGILTLEVYLLANGSNSFQPSQAVFFGDRSLQRHSDVVLKAVFELKALLYVGLLLQGELRLNILRCRRNTGGPVVDVTQFQLSACLSIIVATSEIAYVSPLLHIAFVSAPSL